jgi:hypothetical protein
MNATTANFALHGSFPRLAPSTKPYSALYEVTRTRLLSLAGEVANEALS